MFLPTTYFFELVFSYFELGPKKFFSLIFLSFISFYFTFLFSSIFLYFS